MQDFLLPAPERFTEVKKCDDDDNDEGSCGRTMSLGMNPKFWIFMIVILGLVAGVFFILGPECFAQTSLPGTDASDKLEAAGTLLRILDTALFASSAESVGEFGLG